MWCSPMPAEAVGSLSGWKSQPSRMLQSFLWPVTAAVPWICKCCCVCRMQSTWSQAASRDPDQHSNGSAWRTAPCLRLKDREGEARCGGTNSKNSRHDSILRVGEGYRIHSIPSERLSVKLLPLARNPEFDPLLF